MKWQTKFWIITICALAIFANVMAFGDSNDKCWDNTWSYTGTEACIIFHMFDQNKVLIQEQNQTNHLLAKLLCVQEEWPVDNCIQWELNNTK